MAEIGDVQGYQAHRDVMAHVKAIVKDCHDALSKSTLVFHWLSEEEKNLRMVGEQVRLLQKSLELARKSLFEIKCFDDVNQTFESKRMHEIAKSSIAIIGKQVGDCEKALMQAAREELIGPEDPEAPVKPSMTDWEIKQIKGMDNA